MDRNYIYTTGNSAYFRANRRASGIQIANETPDGTKKGTGLTIANNIVHTVSSGVYYDDSYGGGLHDTKVANNTFYDCDRVTVWVDQRTAGNTDTTTFVNNIFYQLNGRDYTWVPSTGITWTTNAWYGGSSWSIQDGTVTADPKLINPGGDLAGYYKISTSSPCTHAGTAVSYVTVDHWGSNRTSAYSIGAHERDFVATP